MVRDALLAGKDVFVEKPLCLSVKTGEELVALAKDRGRILMVGHLLWYHPAVLKLRDLIRQGELGRIRYIYSNRLNLGKIRREENILWSFAPHDISVILGLLDELPNVVQAQGGNYLHQQIADVTVSLLSFPSGVKAHVFVSWLHPYKEQKLVVVGEKKMAMFDDMEKKDKLLLYPHSIDWKNNIPVANKADAQPVPVEVHSDQKPPEDGRRGGAPCALRAPAMPAGPGNRPTVPTDPTDQTGSTDQTDPTSPDLLRPLVGLRRRVRRNRRWHQHLAHLSDTEWVDDWEDLQYRPEIRRGAQRHLRQRCQYSD
jgi:hypothetical protein